MNLRILTLSHLKASLSLRQFLIGVGGAIAPRWFTASTFVRPALRDGIPHSQADFQIGSGFLSGRSLRSA